MFVNVIFMNKSDWILTFWNILYTQSVSMVQLAQNYYQVNLLHLLNKLNLILHFFALLNVSTNVIKPIVLTGSCLQHCKSHEIFKFLLAFFLIKDFVLMKLNQKLLTLVKTCHLQSFEMSGCLTHLLPMACRIKAPHSMGFGKNGDSLKFILWPWGKSTVIESKGFTIIQSAQIWVIQSVVLYE